MGVRGLKKFITTECNLLIEHKLCNTRIVIDGTNLAAHIHGYLEGSYCGGEYSTLECFFLWFFMALLSCGVTPYVLFDGGCDPSDRKVKTMVCRYIESLHDVQSYILAETDEERIGICPRFDEDSMRCVLRKLRIPYVVCTFEADEEIAWLAHEWNCPVMSDDSDFTIFDLGAGVIPLDTIELDGVIPFEPSKLKGEKDQLYIRVKKFNNTSLIDKFGLSSAEFLPLFASLVGNDYIEATLMEPFFSSVKMPWVTDKCYTNRYQRRKASVLLWLAQMKDVNESVRIILRKFPWSQRRNIGEKLNLSLASYAMQRSKMRCHFGWLEANNVKDYSHETITCDPGSVTTFDGFEVPKWFLSRLWLGFMYPTLLDVLIFHRVMHLGLLEQPDAPSSFQAGRRVRQFIYGILFTVEIPANELQARHTNAFEEASPQKIESISNEKRNRSTYVEEWERRGASIVKLMVPPLFKTPGGALVPRLVDIPNMEQKSRAQFFCHATDIPEDVFITFPEEHRLVLAAAAVWIKNANPKIRKSQVLALLAYIAHKDKPRSMQDAKKDIRTSKTCSGTDSQNKQAETGPELTYKLSTIIEDATPAKCDIRIIHAYQQFQSCLETVNSLNRLLCCPLKGFIPSKIYGGVMIYCMAMELEKKEDPKEWAIGFLQQFSDEAADAFKDLYRCLLT